MSAPLSFEWGIIFMKTILELLVSITGFVAMYDIIGVAFATSPNNNLFIRIGRVYIQLAAGIAGFIIAFFMIIFLEAALSYLFDKIMKPKENDNDEY